MNPRRPAVSECWNAAIVEPSQVADARRRTAAIALRAGFDETRAGALAIVVTEIGNNLVKHGQRGQLIVRSLARGGVGGIELLAIDRGPGIRDLAECLRDGYSSAGTAGTGLGAIRRQADEFDMVSTVPRGTVLLARMWATRPSAPDTGLELGALCVPIPGEVVSGDGWKVLPGPPPRIVVVDGLGHGAAAAEATEAALTVADKNPTAPLADLLSRMHEALRATRGAVAAIAEVDLRRGLVRFAGVGNIMGAVWSTAKTANMVSMNGTLGHAMPRVSEFSYPWPEQGLLVMHSDGISGRWSLDDYPGLAARDPSVVAGVIHRDFSRGRDDATIVVVRAAEAPTWTPPS